MSLVRAVVVFTVRMVSCSDGEVSVERQVQMAVWLHCCGVVGGKTLTSVPA